MNRRSLLTWSIFGFLLIPSLSFSATPAKPILKLIKDPNCGCCNDHAEYLRSHGYTVDVSESEKLAEMRAELGVPEELAGCHVILADRYVIEGHVPAAAIDKLLNDQPDIKGISVPGMPPGSPGMSGERSEPLVVLTIADGMPRVFFTE